MLNRLQIHVLPPGPRYATQLRFWVDGCDVVEDAVDEGGAGVFASSLLCDDRLDLLAATPDGRRVRLGEPDCTGGCCGYLTTMVRRDGETVVWSDWEGPHPDRLPTAFHFSADQYDAELARVAGDRWWEEFAHFSPPGNQ
jgi:hypothetical protein